MHTAILAIFTPQICCGCPFLKAVQNWLWFCLDLLSQSDAHWDSIWFWGTKQSYWQLEPASRGHIGEFSVKLLIFRNLWIGILLRCNYCRDFFVSHVSLKCFKTLQYMLLKSRASYTEDMLLWQYNEYVHRSGTAVRKKLCTACFRLERHWDKL